MIESIPTPDAIKLRDAGAAEAAAAFAATMKWLAAAGLEVVCYNFMPLVDWTRTSLRHPMPSGGLAVRFDMVDFVTYDALILPRLGAEGDYPSALLTQAEASRARDADLAPEDLRANLVAFLQQVVPSAERAGQRLCLHPDEPPFPLFGLPRIVSTLQDYEALAGAVPELVDKVTLCTGSLGSRLDNDVEATARALAPRIHFAHLRAVSLEPDDSFLEDDHLDGRVDMVVVVPALLAGKARRREEGRADALIHFQPDHGHLPPDDQAKAINRGCSATGRLKGLAELRGIAALERAA